MSKTITAGVSSASTLQYTFNRNVNKNGEVREQADLGKVELIKVSDYCTKKESIFSIVATISAVFQNSIIVVKDNNIFVYTMTVGIINSIEKLPGKEQMLFKDFVYSGNTKFIVYRSSEKNTFIHVLEEFSAIWKQIEAMEKTYCQVTVRSEDIVRYHLQVLYKKSLCEGVIHWKDEETEVVSLNLSKKIAQLDFTKVVLPRLESSRRIPLAETKLHHMCQHYPILESDIEYTNKLYDRTENTLPSPVHFHADLQEQGAYGHVQTPSLQAPLQTRYPSYSVYEYRLGTYPDSWDGKPHATHLCRAGFFYIHREEIFRCFYCGIGLKDFSVHDDPFLEHVRYSGQCPVLHDVLGGAELSAVKIKLQMGDPEYNRCLQMREIHRKTVYVYRHPDYESEEARFNSFSRWPLREQFPPLSLARIGLYYTGYETVVRCFACDGGFRKPQAADELWFQHGFYFPSCPYMRIKKGDRFVKIVKGTKTETEEEEKKESEQGAVGGVSLTCEKMREIKIENRVYLQNTCLELGYLEQDIDDALLEMRKRGYSQTIDTLMDLIENIKERRALRDKVEHLLNESRRDQNASLKCIVYCILCKDKANALFLPCTHHKFCMVCAENIEECPICQKNINVKIGTFTV
ncbi:E3 ubiquitin-protein ligase XIAP-like isoform X2 [Mercenaria mercenaria]|uniref:E3 ubiquitin-protein ligase XIAP-like isoform X2 n=1 Tax=Mercenaria mercenaria TaxID=6596 RepID=UPI001E1DDE9A|nr:E3 ubiquitin-protein ligase XIAP-like isoform X2 [Mercenaria mercenaria]